MRTCHWVDCCFRLSWYPLSACFQIGASHCTLSFYVAERVLPACIGSLYTSRFDIFTSFMACSLDRLLVKLLVTGALDDMVYSLERLSESQQYGSNSMVWYLSPYIELRTESLTIWRRSPVDENLVSILSLNPRQECMLASMSSSLPYAKLCRQLVHPFSLAFRPCAGR
jgi:hypothetical protein